jgi:hypothetical protein
MGQSVTPPKLTLASLVGLLAITSVNQLVAKWRTGPLSIIRVNV